MRSGLNRKPFAFCDTIRYVQTPVHTNCIGQAMGTAAMIPSAGRPRATRRPGPTASIVLPSPAPALAVRPVTSRSGPGGAAQQNAPMLDMLSENTGRSAEQSAKDFRSE